MARRPDAGAAAAGTIETAVRHGRPELLDEILDEAQGRSAEIATAEPAARVGRLAGLDGDGRLLFREDGGTGEAVPVTIGVALSDAELTRAALEGARALVLRSAGPRPERVLTALLRERVSAPERSGARVSLDGETLVLTAERRIELRCGEASLVLTHDGRVELRGTQLLSRSSGANKIRGASIALN